MKFSYRKINLQNPFNSKNFILRPIIPFSIGHQGKALRFEALIDSGADFNILPIEIAKKLGITLKNCNRLSFAGVGGKYYRWNKSRSYA